MSRCGRCGKENKGHYKFCLGCGADLTTPGQTLQNELPVDFEKSPADPPTDPDLLAAAPPPSQKTAEAGHKPARPALAPSLAAAAAASRPTSAKTCPQCGTVAPAGFQFCGQCGVSLESSTAARPQQTMHLGQLPKSVGASTVEGRLVLIRPDGTEGGTHHLSEGENLIGRGAGALFESDGYLSPQHAEIVLNAAGVVVRDKNSLNGVFVKIGDEEELVDGDVFRIGQELMRFDEIRPPEPLEDGTQVMGSPNPGYWGRLALVVGRDQEGSAFPLLGDAIILGRERGDILFPEDGYVSGAHARVASRDGRFYLSDMNSSNGTFKKLRGEREIPAGSFLLLGQQLFRVSVP